MKAVERCKQWLCDAETTSGWRCKDLASLEGETACLYSESGDIGEELSDLYALRQEMSFNDLFVEDNFVIVRDDHDKLRYSDQFFEILLLADGGIYGCDDFMPCLDSKLTLLGELHWCDR